MKQKKNKSISRGATLKVTAYLFLMFLMSIGILVLLPSIIRLGETSVLVASNSNGINKEKVLGIFDEKKLVTKLMSSNMKLPKFSATSVIAADYDSDEVMYEKNIHQRLSPASTTKIMTALVAIEYFKSGDLLLVYPEANVGGSNMGLRVGEKLSFRSLLYGMMLNSANDAAFTIAANYPGGVAGFVKAMNNKVSALGLSNTRFDNPAGFDSDSHYSSAYDLSKIAKNALLKSELARIVATKETFVSSWEEASVSGQRHNLRNLNILLSIEGVLGIKTGFTEKAGESFVGLVEREGHKVITVVLNSEDRFGETKILMDYIYQNYNWIQVFE